MEETREILDKLLVNNDTNISDIIIDYTYPRCIECNKQDIILLPAFNNKVICCDCSILDRYRKCGSCDLIFNLSQSDYCRACNRNCLVFCSNCPCEEESLRILSTLINNN